MKNLEIDYGTEQAASQRLVPIEIKQNPIMSTKNLTINSKDLTKEYPRSPRETLGGYVIAARTLDKCRAQLAGKLGEYHFDCPLDKLFFEFAGISADQFKDFVATGASDKEMASWINTQARQRPQIEVIKWNNKMRDKRLSDLPDEAQEFLEEYIPKCLSKGRPVYCWFDVYDIEEKRI